MSVPKNENKILKIFKGSIDEEELNELDEDFLPEEINEIADYPKEKNKIEAKKKQELLENKFKEDDRNKDKKKPNEEK